MRTLKSSRVLKPLALAILAGVSLSACQVGGTNIRSSDPTYEEAAKYPLKNVNYLAAEALMAGVPVTKETSTSNKGHPSVSGSMVVATIANLDNLDHSSSLGRTVSEHLASWFAQRGIAVVELKVRNGVYVKNGEGEFLLTRELREIANAHQAKAAVVGTYSVGSKFVHINLKMVNPETSQVLSAHDYTLPLDGQIRSLLAQRR